MECKTNGDAHSSHDNRDHLTSGHDSDFYRNAVSYWEKIPATVNGMLGGFERISASDIKGSGSFLANLFHADVPPGRSRAVDCGAGIGRITRDLLLKSFERVDLVEQCEHFLAEARVSLSDHAGIGECYQMGLQDFAPPPSTYDVIWCQWVLGHLTDHDLRAFFVRMACALRPAGVIIIKENVTSSGEVETDEEDSSVTRPEELLLNIIESAGLHVFRNIKQSHFPIGLYTVKMIAAVPFKE